VLVGAIKILPDGKTWKGSNRDHKEIGRPVREKNGMKIGFGGRCRCALSGPIETWVGGLLITPPIPSSTRRFPIAVSIWTAFRTCLERLRDFAHNPNRVETCGLPGLAKRNGESAYIRVVHYGRHDVASHAGIDRMIVWFPAGGARCLTAIGHEQSFEENDV